MNEKEDALQLYDHALADWNLSTIADSMQKKTMLRMIREHVVRMRVRHPTDAFLREKNGALEILQIMDASLTEDIRYAKNQLNIKEK